MSRPWEVYAYSFRSDLPLAGIFSRLTEQGTWRWLERDNDNWGEYLSSRVLHDPDHGMVKIFAEGDGAYVVNVSLESSQPDAQARYDAVRKTLLEKILPALGARDVADADTRE
jgi:hypothetical protein